MGTGKSVPATMRAISFDRPGEAEVLRPQSRPVPRPGPGEVLIKVAAAGVNGADIVQREGKYNLPPDITDILGLEVAGTVIEVGEGVSQYSRGDDVCALVVGGGYAEYCIAPEIQCLPVPRGLSLVEAASLPEVLMTVWLNVFELGRLKKGEVLLVHGGSSGVGTMAIQLARALGATVIATAGSAEKCRACVELGAVRAIDYRQEEFGPAVMQQTEGKGVDVVLEMIGGDYLPRDLEVMAPGGRLVMIAFKRATKVELDCSLIQRKQLFVTGSRLRFRPIAEKAALANSLRQVVWPLIESGTVRPVIDSTFPLVEAALAHKRMESRQHIGKIMLTT